MDELEEEFTRIDLREGDSAWILLCRECLRVDCLLVVDCRALVADFALSGVPPSSTENTRQSTTANKTAGDWMVKKDRPESTRHKGKDFSFIQNERKTYL